MSSSLICVACDKPASPMDHTVHGPIHMSCVIARATAVRSGRCHCGSQRREGEEKAPHGPRGRRFVPCLRCLGVIRQTN